MELDDFLTEQQCEEYYHDDSYGLSRVADEETNDESCIVLSE